MTLSASETPIAPLASGLLLGLGLGGFVDGIVFHQILQWHHMATSAGYPATSLRNLEFNTLLDGVFHAATWVLTLAGAFLLWRQSGHYRLGLRGLCGTLLMGFGAFNLVEGTVDHFLLGIHHVNETAPREQWLWWDVAFLIWGGLMLAGGYVLWRRPAAKAGRPSAS